MLSSTYMLSSLSTSLGMEMATTGTKDMAVAKKLEEWQMLAPIKGIPTTYACCYI
uniref:Uncharacterized protein n=1 Tax=Arundo donax TaxID=35708 RepID=A0A0A8YM92_ARUDO